MQPTMAKLTIHRDPKVRDENVILLGFTTNRSGGLVSWIIARADGDVGEYNVQEAALNVRFSPLSLAAGGAVR